MDTTKTQTGSYVAVKLSDDTQNRLSKFTNTFSLKNNVPKEKFHVTEIYSTKSLPESFEALGNIDPPIIAQPKHLTVFTSKTDSRALVLEMDCPELVKRHKELMEKYDLTYDFPEYKVHVTLSYDIGDWEIPTIVNYKDVQDLEIVYEYSEALNLNWAKENTNTDDDSDA